MKKESVSVRIWAMWESLLRAINTQQLLVRVFQLSRLPICIVEGHKHSAITGQSFAGFASPHMHY
jgi:hypothetical protein